ncbi:MAG: hypothetical protein C5B50_05570 [Verrucomicrobia bacterium]|nr:MAG: hypothetical protein C5B50_05570 [Verrucomicrobiota bacterium]
MEQHLDKSGRNSIQAPASGLSALKLPSLAANGVDTRAQRKGYHQDAPDSNRAKLRIPVLDSQASVLVHTDRYASKYVPVEWRTVTAEERRARRIAWQLKDGLEDAIEIAAPAMAALIDAPCWLVPVPASDGTLTANLELARAIAALVPRARVKCALTRSHPVESSCDRRLDGRFGLNIEQHAIIRVAGPMQVMPAYFVDNVITTGTTIAACRRALGWGTGLAFADGSTWKNTRSRP